MKMLRHPVRVMSLASIVVVQSAVGSVGVDRRCPVMHAPHASSEVLWNPIGGKTVAVEYGPGDSAAYRSWAGSIDDDRYLDFLSRDGVLSAPVSAKPDPVPGFGPPRASVFDRKAGDDILEIVEAGRAGISEVDDPVRRWCAIGELPSRTDVAHGLSRNQFFLGRGRGVSDEIDYERLHEMVFEVPAAVAHRYDATGDGVLDDVVAVDVGGLVVQVVAVGGEQQGNGSRRGGYEDDRCVVARSAVIAAWIERRRKEGY